ncbi:MAG TPA: lipid II flippase MurJ [Candidatus Methanoperedens sp.]|nr:lipid II flippase MurJ [Candidatus Methanoperedens sp.]
MKGRSILSVSLLLAPVQAVLRAGELLLPLLLAAWFGRSAATDVYYFSWAVFTFAGSLVFAAYLDSALIPILAEIRLRDRRELPAVTGALIGHTLLYGALLAALVGAGALAAFGARYRGADFTLAAAMVPAFSVYLVALSLKTLFAAMLNAEHRFFAHPVASALGVAATIGVIALGRGKLGVAVIPYASLAGELVAVAALLAVALGPARMRFVLSLARPEPLLAFARLSVAQLSGSAVVRLNPVVDMLVAGFTGVVGGGTLLRYVGDVAYLPTSLLQAAVLSVLLSHLSDDFARRDLARVRRTVVVTLASVAALLATAGALLFVLRAPLLRLVYLRGQMDAAGVAQMAEIMPYYLAGLVPFGALLVFARAHVALRNSTIMLSMAVLNAACNAALNLALVHPLGLRGIALSTACTNLVVAVVFWFRLEARLRRLASSSDLAGGAPARG